MRPNEIELRGRIEFGSIEKMAATPDQRANTRGGKESSEEGPWKRRAECVGRWRRRWDLHSLAAGYIVGEHRCGMSVMDVRSCGQLLARQGRGVVYLGIGRASRLALIILSCPPHSLFIPSGAGPDWNGRCQWG